MTSNFTFADFSAMCEKIFSYPSPSLKIFIYKGIYWRTLPLEISDGDSLGPWRVPAEQELENLPEQFK